MRAEHILLSLAILMVPIADAEPAAPPEKLTHTQTAPPSAVQATPDLLVDLFPSTPGSSERSSQPFVVTKQPIYESWDVLRQYPRYESLAPATVPEPKALELKQSVKE